MSLRCLGWVLLVLLTLLLPGYDDRPAVRVSLCGSALLLGVLP